MVVDQEWHKLEWKLAEKLTPVDFLPHVVCPLFRSLSTGRLTDLLLKAAFGAQISEAGSNDSLNNEKPMEIAGRWGGQADLAGCPGLGQTVCLHAFYKWEAAFLMAFGKGSDCGV